jgi:hypothetical protein
MKLKSFTFTLAVLAAAIFFVSGCGSKPDVKTTAPEPVRFVVLEEGGYRWFVVISQVDYLPDNPPGAVIKIRNELDRNLTVDFDGPSHYTFSIGDKKDQTVNIRAGSYKLMASSPGITFIPKDYRYNYRDRYVYRQVWNREKLSTRY